MKYFALLLLGGLFLLAGVAQAQATVTLPAVTSPSATVPWTLPSNCTATATCQFQVYRLAGTCPGTLSGSTGWTLVGTSAAQAVSFQDTTVTSSTQYSYDVEAVPAGSTTVFSGPSNCSTVTIPFTPAAPVIGTITTT